MRYSEIIPESNLEKFMKGSKAPPVLYHSTNADWTIFDPKKSMMGSYGFQAHAVQDTGGTSHNVNAKRSINGMNVMPVHLNIKNPLRMEDKGTWSPWEMVTRLDKDHNISDKNPLPSDAIKLAGQDQYNHQISSWERKSEALKKYEAYVRPLAMKAYKEWDRENPGGGNNREKFIELENEIGKQYITNLMMQAGYDGIVYDNKHEGDGDSYIAFFPNQIKSAIGNKGTFDPNNQDITENIA